MTISNINKGLSGVPAVSGVLPTTYTFTDIDGSTGFTVNHNLGYRPSTVVVGTLASTGTEDKESFGNLQHQSVNQFTVTWLGGVASGSVTYY